MPHLKSSNRSVEWLDRCAAGAAATAGAALAVSIGLPWTANGPASSIPGYRAANLLMGSHNVIPGIPWWIGPVFYLIPVTGAVTWIALGVWGRALPRWYLVLSAAGIAAAAVLTGWIVVAGDLATLGSGALLAALGSLFLACALGRVSRSQHRAPMSGLEPQ